MNSVSHAHKLRSKATRSTSVPAQELKSTVEADTPSVFPNLFDCVSVDEVRADEEKLIHQLYKVLQSSVVHDVKPSGVLSVDVTTLRGVKIMKILHLCKLHEL